MAKDSQVGPNNIKLLVAEFLGTGLLLFLGCMGCLGAHTDVPGYMSSLSFGLTVMVIIQMFGHISGAHLNPAVTMVTVLSGIVELKSAPFYLLGQFAGAICGLGGLKLLMPSDFIAQDFIDENTNQTIHKLGLCTTNLNSNLTPAQGFGIEVVITFILIFVCYALWDKRNSTKQDSVPLRFGFLIAAIGIAAGPFTGGSMNTARSFAPALLNNDWENQWIYWIGPTLGALIAHYFYKLIFSLPAEDSEEDEYDEVSLKVMKDDAKA